MGERCPELEKRRWDYMVKYGICGGEAPKQPCITEEGKCDLCGKKVVLAEEKEKKKCNYSASPKPVG